MLLCCGCWPIKAWSMQRAHSRSGGKWEEQEGGDAAGKAFLVCHPPTSLSTTAFPGLERPGWLLGWQCWFLAMAPGIENWEGKRGTQDCHCKANGGKGFCWVGGDAHRQPEMCPFENWPLWTCLVVPHGSQARSCPFFPSYKMQSNAGFGYFSIFRYPRDLLQKPGMLHRSRRII